MLAGRALQWSGWLLEKVIRKKLLPKVFKDEQTDCMSYITGAQPLEQLLTALINASEKTSLDWPSALRSFNEKAWSCNAEYGGITSSYTHTHTQDIF